MGTHPIFESDFDCLTEGSSMADVELMTENEREAYFQRDESLMERWNAFTSESYFSTVLSGVKSVPDKYSQLSDWGFNVAPVAVVWCLWSTLMSERYATML